MNWVYIVDKKVYCFDKEELEYINHVAEKFDYVYLHRSNGHHLELSLKKNEVYMDEETYPLVILNKD